MGELSDDDISSNRLNAIKMLLAKTLPDLSSISIEGAGDNGEILNKVIVEFIKTNGD